jgi:hypothetical protein
MVDLLSKLAYQLTFVEHKLEIGKYLELQKQEI